MVNAPELSPSLASERLLGVLIEAPELDAFLDKVVCLAADALTPAHAGGITVRRDGQPFTVASSNELAARVDEIQYGAGEGPCLHARRTGEVVRVDHLAQDERWPTYRPHAVAHGVVSSLSLPLNVDGQTLGALSHPSPAPASNCPNTSPAIATPRPDHRPGTRSTTIRRGERSTAAAG